MADPDADERRRALAAVGVSRETEQRLVTLVAELRRWQTIKNLVGPKTLDEVWSRHVLDSLQLVGLAPGARRWLDLGSGAGFPGLVVAIALADAQPDAAVHLVESNGRKCAFLRHAARVTGAPVTVHEARIEDVIDRFAGAVDVVTARALAPLGQLIAWSAPVLTTGAEGLFPKGRDAANELTAAGESWKFSAALIPSRTDAAGQIVRLRSVAKK